MSDTTTNRTPLDSEIFASRGTRVKWPTIRKAWITDESSEALKTYVMSKGHSIIFLDGTYRTNLNKWSSKDPIERAVFFEFMVKHPRVRGAIFLLAWLGNFHNGSIFHCGWQYPQIRCWYELGVGAEKFFEKKSFDLYTSVVNILYEHSSHKMDSEVESFISQ
jgi:hypothetical protein